MAFGNFGKRGYLGGINQGKPFPMPGSGERSRYAASTGIMDRTPIRRRTTSEVVSVIMRSLFYGFKPFHKERPRGVTGS